MSRSPLVSIVIVNFNTGALLLDCVASVLGTTCPKEVIIVDNGSTDGSVLAIRQAHGDNNECRIVENGKNLGFSAAANIGLDAATGFHIVLLNPDCLVQPHSISGLVDIFNEYPQAGVVGGLVFNGNGREQRGCRRREPTIGRSILQILNVGRLFARLQNQQVDSSRDPLPSAPVHVDAVSGSFMAIKKHVLEEIGGMDEGYFLHCEDLDLCRRVREAGYQVIFAPGVSVVHHRGISTRSAPIRAAWSKHRGMWRYYGKFQKPGASAFTSGLVFIGVHGRFAVVFFGLLVRALGRWTKSSANAVVIPAATVPIVSHDRAVVLLFGATSLVGDSLLTGLHRAGFQVVAVGRKPKPKTDGHSHCVPLEYFAKVPAADFPAASVLVSAVPIWVVSSFLPKAKSLGIKHVVAVSSTSVLTKAYDRDCADDREAAVVRELAAGERFVEGFCTKHGIDYTILRPTMIFDGERDRNIALIASVTKWLHVFPLVDNGRGLRQPIYAGDVAEACVKSIMTDASRNKIYNIGGGQTLSYREMVSAISNASGSRIWFIPVSLEAFRRLLAVLSIVPGLRFLTPAMADRMSQDLCFSNHDAERDLHFRPVAFSDLLDQRCS